LLAKNKMFSQTNYVFANKYRAMIAQNYRGYFPSPQILADMDLGGRRLAAGIPTVSGTPTSRGTYDRP